MVNFQECLKTHPLLHVVSGAGIGLLLVGLLPGLATNAVLLGAVLVVVGVVLEVVLGK